jgi:hypothetical protein
VVGGYNPLGFDGYGPKATLGAFLFTWPDGDWRQLPHKLPKVGLQQALGARQVGMQAGTRGVRAAPGRETADAPEAGGGAGARYTPVPHALTGLQ